MDLGGGRANSALALKQELSYTKIGGVGIGSPAPPIEKKEVAMTVVNFPPSSPPVPLHCEECSGSRFFVYEDQSFVCATCGYQYDWGPGTNGNGHEQPELKFEPDPDLIAIVTNGKREEEPK